MRPEPARFPAHLLHESTQWRALGGSEDIDREGGPLPWIVNSSWSSWLLRSAEKKT